MLLGSNINWLCLSFKGGFIRKTLGGSKNRRKGWLYKSNEKKRNLKNMENRNFFPECNHNKKQLY